MEVLCSDHACLNNRKGKCAANKIKINKQGRCKDFCKAASYIRKNKGVLLEKE